MGRPGLTKHRKFARLSRLIGSRALARGCLELLWDASYESGDDLLGTVQDLEYQAGWEGQPGVLAQALIDAGFVDRDGDFLRVHDLLDHAPDYVRRRLQRERQRREKGAKSRAVTGQRPGIDQPVTLTPSTQHPAPSTKEEASASSCSEPDKQASELPPVLVFPCVGKGPKTWNLSPSKVAEFRESYPGVDVLAECRRALQWCRDNPTRQKTPRGMGKFLNAWLSRSQDGQFGRPGTPQAPTSLDFGDLDR